MTLGLLTLAGSAGADAASRYAMTGDPSEAAAALSKGLIAATPVGALIMGAWTALELTGAIRHGSSARSSQRRAMWAAGMKAEDVAYLLWVPDPEAQYTGWERAEIIRLILRDQISALGPDALRDYLALAEPARRIGARQVAAPASRWPKPASRWSEWEQCYRYADDVYGGRTTPARVRAGLVPKGSGFGQVFTRSIRESIIERYGECAGKAVRSV